MTYEHTASYRPPQEARRLVRLGADLFSKNCRICHGAEMEGQILANGVEAPPLVKAGFRTFFILMPHGMEGFVREQIAEGVGIMPPFSGMLSETELEALAFHLREANLKGMNRR